MERLLAKLGASQNVAVFTGAGVSTLCGIPDFRGPQGLYRQPDAEKIFDIAWFRRDPAIYYTGCRQLIYGLRDIAPGVVHKAVAHLEALGVVAGVITQNIDMLHQKAGSRTVYEVHGSPLLHHCVECGRAATFAEVCALLESVTVARCEACGAPYKPDVTFFGEMLPQQAYTGAVELALRAPLTLVLGSSLTVHPAAGLPALTVEHGGELAIVNAQTTPYDHLATYRHADLQTFAEAVLQLQVA